MKVDIEETHEEKHARLEAELEEEIDEEYHEKWSSRWSFILASIGSAIGLGNFWRFPIFVYKHGGGPFFIPYLIALFFVGIPLLQLEMAVGQVFQKAATQGFGMLHPRFRGLGLAAAGISFGIVTYYATILGWGNVMLVKSFFSEIPWSIRDANGTDVLSIPELHFKEEILRRAATPTSPTEIIASHIWAGSFFMWFSVLAILIRGQKFLSKAVWFTVLLPVVTLLILVGVGSSLDGAVDGIKAYIANWDMEKISDGEMWVDAFSQTFFSIGLSTGVMTAFASLNPSNQDIAKDAAIVAICNAAFSFVSGFAVFTIVGYFSYESGISVEELNAKNLLGGPSLAFVTYPAALTLVDGAAANVLCVTFFVTFYFLGVDSAFSLVESVVYNFHETELFKSLSREQLIVAVCCVGMFISTMYCSDIGLFLFDAVDFYISSWGLLIVGLLELLVAGWVYNKAEVIEKVGAPAALGFDALYLGGSVIFTGVALGIAEVEDASQGVILGVPIAIGIVFIAGSFLVGGVLGSSKAGSFKDALYYCALYGPESLVETFNAVITKDKPNNWKFGRPWLVCIKFICPPLLIFLNGIRVKQLVVQEGYGGYPVFYQILGAACLLVIVMLWFIGVLVPQLYRDPRDRKVEI